MYPHCHHLPHHPQHLQTFPLKPSTPHHTTPTPHPHRSGWAAHHPSPPATHHHPRRPTSPPPPCPYTNTHHHSHSLFLSTSLLRSALKLHRLTPIRSDHFFPHTIDLDSNHRKILTAATDFGSDCTTAEIGFRRRISDKGKVVVVMCRRCAVYGGRR